ncbi:IclR family transcriptional regulator [Tritonibacter litoralis]|nr:IclR family transcriptional regulator [Tritonibacter litoralis]
MSSTVTKALALLDHFSEDDPEIGLSDLARRAGLDKATVHRMLNAMADSGLVEQTSSTKLYRLGAGVLRLARVRETVFPVTAVFQAALDRLSTATGETAHASLISGRALATIGFSESNRSNRVSLVAGEILPIHSTASGLSVLAFSSKDFVNKVLASPLSAKTKATVTDSDALQTSIAKASDNGFAIADQTNEEEVYGIAVPVFGSDGFACGALAVATPIHRMNDTLRGQIVQSLFDEVANTTFGIGGRVPTDFSTKIEKSLSKMGL